MQIRFLDKEVSSERKRCGKSWEEEDAICPSAESVRAGVFLLAPSDSWRVGTRFPGFPAADSSLCRVPVKSKRLSHCVLRDVESWVTDNA